jgi:ribokinase
VVTVDHLPAPGETVTGGVYSQHPGGKGANQAVAAARASGAGAGSTSPRSAGADQATSVTLVANVGSDPQSAQMVEGFARDGIDTSEIRALTDVATGAALITVDAKGENCIAVAPGANFQFPPARVDEVARLIRESAVVLLQYELPTETVVRALEIAADAGTEVLFNFAPPHEFPADHLARVGTLVVNESEATIVSGVTVTDVDSARSAALRISELGVNRVLVTLGPDGVLLLEGGESAHVPAFHVHAVDTTAAGDTFCGCLAVAIAEGQSLTDAVRFASAGAALSVQRRGAQPSIPVRDEIDAFLALQDTTAT